jgi:hypothetical protein
MAIAPGTNVIARELTVAVPGSVGREDGGDGLGQLIHLGLVPGGHPGCTVRPSDDGCAGWPR